MKRNLKTVFIPFPAGLMSTARPPTTTPDSFAREVINMYALKSGAGAKRNGCVKVGNAISGEEVVRLMYFIPQGGDVQILAATSSGKIYLKNEDDWDEKLAGLDASGTLRWTHFDGRLILCNGVDDVVAWNGTTFETVYEYVQDSSANLTYVDSTTFTIDGDMVDYPVGYKVKARLGAGIEVESTVASSTGTGTITVTLDDAVLTNALDEIYFESRPPKFAFVYAAHDRLWGFGKGPLKADSFSDDVDRNRVFYTAGVNNNTDWYDIDGLAQSINLQDKLPVIDELVAMRVKDGMTVFFFRNFIQVWAGSDPTLSGDFTWVKTIPLGLVHGDLAVDLPNDIGFFTRFGARTLSRVLQTEQLDVGDLGSEVDPSIAESVQTMLSSDANYRNVHAFQHDRQGWFGFKPSGESLIFQASQASRGWALFDGLFESATAFLNTPDGKLYLASGGQLYRYDESVWDDDGTAISTRWWTPWKGVGASNNRWANKYVEVMAEQGVAVELSVKRFKNYDSSSNTPNITTIQNTPDYWDEGDWDLAYWDNISPQPPIMRDRFVSDVLAYAVESSTLTGPVILYGLKLHGIQEK